MIEMPFSSPPGYAGAVPAPPEAGDALWFVSPGRAAARRGGRARHRQARRRSADLPAPQRGACRWRRRPRRSRSEPLRTLYLGLLGGAHCFAAEAAADRRRKGSAGTGYGRSSACWRMRTSRSPAAHSSSSSGTGRTSSAGAADADGAEDDRAPRASAPRAGSVPTRASRRRSWRHPARPRRDPARAPAALPAWDVQRLRASSSQARRSSNASSAKCWRRSACRSRTCAISRFTWPFPHSLMIAFVADWKSGEINVDPLEIEAAQWFNVRELPQLPNRISKHFAAADRRGGGGDEGPDPITGMSVGRATHPCDLYRCGGDARYLTNSTLLRNVCIQAIEKAGLTVLGELFHQFEGGGTTGCVVLAESHVAIHTWPEFRSVTLDAFVCNYSRDNSERARGMVDELVALFRPRDVVRHEVPRDLTVAEAHWSRIAPRRATGGRWNASARRLRDQGRCAACRHAGEAEVGPAAGRSRCRRGRGSSRTPSSTRASRARYSRRGWRAWCGR